MTKPDDPQRHQGERTGQSSEDSAAAKPAAEQVGQNDDATIFTNLNVASPGQTFDQVSEENEESEASGGGPVAGGSSAPTIVTRPQPSGAVANGAPAREDAGGVEQVQVTMATGSPAAAQVHKGNDPVPGEVWGDYQFEKLLGRGGMGSVFRGRQVSLERPVAIKILPAHLSQNPDFRKRFVLEARAVAQISSPHVIQVYAAGEHQGNSYFAMEYVAGQDLAEKLKSGYRPQPEQALALVLQAAKGLAAAGDLDIVHRDIKPSNMMVTDDGQLKLMDFGLVKLTRESTSITMTGTVMGTVTYFSPEQGRGDTCDQRTDIYALGVVFYEILTGMLPFTGADPSAIIYQHLHAEPKLPREINPSIPEAYQAVVLKCMQKEPIDRYQNAHELVKDLEAVRSGREPQTAMLDPRMLRSGAAMGKSTQFSAERRSRNRVWLVAMLVVLGVAAGGLWFAQQQGMLRVASEDTSVNASQGSVAVDGGSASQQSVDDRSTEGSDQSASETDLGTSEVAPQLSVEPATETAATPAGQSQSAAADRLAKAQALITAVEQALADADAEEAQAQLHALQSLAPNHAALAGLRDRLALLQDVQDARGRAHIALSEGEPGRALGMIAVLDVSGVASPERDRVQALRADAAYVQQMLSTAVQALARNDLETARQCYLDAFNRAENRAARRGLEVVPLCHQFTDALSAGSISKAAGLLGEIEGMGMPDAVLAPRRTELEVHQLVANMRRLIQAYDFDGAQKSLERLRVVDPEAHQIDQLAHAIELGRRMAAFNHSLAARDLAAAQRDLALIRDLDGEGPAWQDAHGRLQASQLEEEAAAQKITDLATLAHDAIVAEHPDWDAIERAIERVQAEAGVDAAVVTELKSLAADRRLREVLLARLSALDEAVVTGDRVKVESLVHDADHAAALLFFVGREELVFEHQLTNLERGDLMAATMVTLTVASKAYPEAVVTSRYQWKVVDGQWVIEVSELQ